MCWMGDPRHVDINQLVDSLASRQFFLGDLGDYWGLQCIATIFWGDDNYCLVTILIIVWRQFFLLLDGDNYFGSR